ncbi:MAG: nucleotide sugar dehydrogenase [Gammaproteobacteria bacterium]
MTTKRNISVIGMGYVGLPVAVAFGKQRQVIGFDIDDRRVEELTQGRDRTGEVTGEELAATDIRFTSDASDLASADFHIVAVPTPITDAKYPDTRALLEASRTLGGVLKKGDIVVYESTVYPGATEEECLPLLESESGLQGGKDFFIGYSPERINPGDKEHVFTNIIKVVSGQNDEILEIVAGVYESVVTAGVHRAPSIKVAEAAKVIENTQRDVNIALMNELALVFERMGIDTNDVLAAARTKWNFLPFTPGLVGGHCIGIDPYYLSYKATITGHIPDLIIDARNINDGMGAFIASQIIKELILAGSPVRDATITVLGLTFKENVPDIRNTRVVDIIHELREYGTRIQIHDACADAEEVREEYGLTLTALDELAPAECVILCVPHHQYREEGWELIKRCLGKGSGVVYDVKGCLPREQTPDGIVLKRL